MRKIIQITSVAVIVIAGIYIILSAYDNRKAIALNDALAKTYQDSVIEELPVQRNEFLKDEWLAINSINTTETTTAALAIVTETQETEKIPETTEPVTETSDENILVIQRSLEPFFAQNSDTAGWLQINNTKINNIVVQTTDNEFYLNHDFRKESSKPGTLFIDRRCVLNVREEEQSRNIIIYGHKQRNGTMFGTLHNYHNDIDFYKSNPTFSFSTLYENYTYKVLAMFTCRTTGNNVFDYHNYIDLPENGDRSFDEWISNVRKYSEIQTPVSASKDDYYLTLSTCSYEYPNSRFVVIARRVRENESPEVEVDKAIMSE